MMDGDIELIKDIAIINGHISIREAWGRQFKGLICMCCMQYIWVEDKAADTYPISALRYTKPCQ